MQPAGQGPIEGTGDADIASGQTTQLNFDFPQARDSSRIEGYLRGADLDVPDSQRPSVFITSRNGDHFSATSCCRADIDAAGHFETQPLPAGLQDVSVYIPPDSSNPQGARVVHELVRTSPGFTYQVELDAGTPVKLVGFVGNDAGGVLAEVWVLGGDRKNEIEQGVLFQELVPPIPGFSVQTDADGIFTKDGIHPFASRLFGDITVLARLSSGALVSEVIAPPGFNSDEIVILWVEP